MKKEDLETVLDNHVKWLNGEGGSRADLSGADLTGADLTGADLTGANLSGANLRGASALASGEYTIPKASRNASGGIMVSLAPVKKTSAEKKALAILEALGYKVSK